MKRAQVYRVLREGLDLGMAPIGAIPDPSRRRGPLEWRFSGNREAPSGSSGTGPIVRLELVDLSSASQWEGGSFRVQLGERDEDMGEQLTTNLIQAIEPKRRDLYVRNNKLNLARLETSLRQTLTNLLMESLYDFQLFFMTDADLKGWADLIASDIPGALERLEV